MGHTHKLQGHFLPFLSAQEAIHALQQLTRQHIPFQWLAMLEPFLLWGRRTALGSALQAHLGVHVKTPQHRAEQEISVPQALAASCCAPLERILVREVPLVMFAATMRG